MTVGGILFLVFVAVCLQSYRAEIDRRDYIVKRYPWWRIHAHRFVPRSKP